ncbi:MAG: DUF815 domain-containing protein [Defluviitaleaceae bacterium]|nr:DUF815 domain-containing protein [Defluviitaleaceae bacterium]
MINSGLLDFIYMLDGLVVFKSLKKDPVLSRFRKMVLQLMDQESPDSALLARGLYHEALPYLLETAENEGFAGNIFQKYILNRVLADVNPFSLAYAGGGGLEENSSLADYALRDFKSLIYLMKFDIPTHAAQLWGRDDAIANYIPIKFSEDDFYAELCNADSPQALADLLQMYYSSVGLGDIGRYCWLKFDGRRICGVSADLAAANIHQHEREELAKNAINYIHNLPFENTLIIGEGGSGKTAAMQLLARDLQHRSLRVLVLKAADLVKISKIARIIAPHNKKFVFFIDDLTQTDYDRYFPHINEAAQMGMPLYAAACQDFPSHIFGLRINLPKLEQSGFVDCAQKIAKHEGLELTDEFLSEYAQKYANAENYTPGAARYTVNKIKLELSQE